GGLRGTGRIGGDAHDQLSGRRRRSPAEGIRVGERSPSLDAQLGAALVRALGAPVRRSFGLAQAPGNRARPRRLPDRRVGPGVVPARDGSRITPKKTEFGPPAPRPRKRAALQPPPAAGRGAREGERPSGFPSGARGRAGGALALARGAFAPQPPLPRSRG